MAKLTRYQCTTEQCTNTMEYGGMGRYPTRCDDCKAARKRAYNKAGRAVQSAGTGHPTCSAEGCDRASNARGMCLMHFKRTRPRTPDKQRAVACVICGVTVMRSPVYGSARTFGHTCSQQCTSVLRGSERCELPADHWARMWGATSPIYARTCARCERPFVAKRSITRYCTAACANPHVPVPLLTLNCTECWQRFTTHQSRSQWCSKRCSRRVAKRARRAHEHQAIGTYTWMDITKLWALFDKACAYCRTPTPLDQIQGEHVIPISRRGANNLSNLLPACRFCNGDKRDLSLTAWAKSRATRGLAPVHTTWDQGDPRYKHLVITGQLDLAA